MKKLVYIAGAYSGPNAWQREQNIRAAEAQSLHLWLAGVPTICVHTMARHFFGIVPEETATAIDDAILLRCDGVLLVEGWMHSAGTRREIDLANANGLRVFGASDVQPCIAWALGRISA